VSPLAASTVAIVVSSTVVASIAVTVGWARTYTHESNYKAIRTSLFQEVSSRVHFLERFTCLQTIVVHSPSSGFESVLTWRSRLQQILPRKMSLGHFRTHAFLARLPIHGLHALLASIARRKICYRHRLNLRCNNTVLIQVSQSIFLIAGLADFLPNNFLSKECLYRRW
jgi:hypothetical protein